MDITQPTRAETTYTSTITLDHGTFSNVARIWPEPGGTFTVSGNTLTFNFTDYGRLDGLTFTTPAAANTITFTLNIAGRPATASQIFLGQNHTASRTGSPLTYRRTIGQ